jgi:drug/metabolite transporter (DMT)-like permease
LILGELAALGTSIAWAFTSIFFTIGGREVGAAVVNRSRLLFAIVLVSLAHWLLLGRLFPFEAEPFRWFWLALSSILGLIAGDGMLFQAFIHLGPRLSQLIMSLAPIFATLMAGVFFGETIERIELFGIGLTILGVGWVVSERRGPSVVVDKHYGRGLLFALGGAMGQASGLIASRLGLSGEFDPLSANLIRLVVAAAILWSLTIAQGRVGYTIQQWRNRKGLLGIAGGTIAGPFSGIWLSLIAIKLTRIGIASTLMSLAPIILIPLSRIFFKEPITLRSIAGTIIALAGVAVLFVE